MLNAFDDALFGSDAVCISVTARHGYCRLNDIAVVRGREKFGDLYFISHLYQPLSFHFKFSSRINMPSFCINTQCEYICKYN